MYKLILFISTLFASHKIYKNNYKLPVTQKKDKCTQTYIIHKKDKCTQTYNIYKKDKSTHMNIIDDNDESDKRMIEIFRSINHASLKKYIN